MDDGGDVWIFIDFCGVFYFAFLIQFVVEKLGMKSCLWGGLGFECDVSGSVVKCLEEERKNLCQSPWNYVNDDPFG